MKIFAKLEMINPTGSIKDRIAENIIFNSAAKEKNYTRHSMIIEASSGNTGTAIARIASKKKYKAIICMSEKTGFEKIAAIRLMAQK